MQPASPAPPHQVSLWLRAAWKPVLMLAGLAGLGLALRGLGFDPRAAVETAGQQGPAAFLVLAAAACAAAVPRQAVALAAGYGFGFWAGCALALAAEILGCAIDFYWARL